MPDSLLALFLFVYSLLVLLGAAECMGMLLQRLTRNALPPSYVLPLGFALVPVLASYGGFLGIWRIPFSTEIVGFLCMMFGVRMMVRLIRRMTFADVRQSLLLYAVPGLAVLAVLLTKWGSLAAGISHGDELRSIAFVGAFANSGLKPVYLFDASVPVAYPFNIFEAAAFAYRSVRGMLYPTIPLFAATLLAIAGMYRVLHLACRSFFAEKGDQMFLLTSIFLTFSTLHGYEPFFPSLRLLFGGIVQPVNANMHAGYHYLWGISLAMLAIAHLWKFLGDAPARQDCFLFSLLLPLGFSNAGIPVLWLMMGLVLPVLWFVSRRGWSGMLRLLREAHVFVILNVLILLPQSFNFLPRLIEPFAFSWPHVWYPRVVDGVLQHHASLPVFPTRILLAPLMIMRCIGPVLTIVLLLSPFLALREWRKRPASPVLPLIFVLATSCLILTFTNSVSSDWFSRGFIATTVVAAMAAAALLHPWLFERRSLLLLIVLIILAPVHVTSFALEHWSSRSKPFVDLPGLRAMNVAYPLGTTLYSSEYGDKAHMGVFAGRSVVTVPPAPLFAYFLKPSVYNDWLGIETSFVPCTQSWYGKNTPQGFFVYLDGEEPEAIDCSHVLVTPSSEERVIPLGTDKSR